MGMKEPPVPADEDSRLGVLNALDLHDSATRYFLNGSLDLLANLCGGKTCSVEFADRIVVSVFTSDSPDPVQAARHESLASFTILDDEPLIIHDISESSYWIKGAAEEMSHTHSYLGYPIILDGARIGALSVTSQVSEEFSVLEMHTAKRLTIQIQEYLKLSKRTHSTIQLNRQLQAERHRFSALHKVSAIAELNIDANFTFVNEQFSRIYGYASNQIIGKNHSVLLPYHHRTCDEYRSILQRLRAREVVHEESERITRDKQVVWVMAIYAPILNFSGEVIKFVEYSIDITDRKVSNLKCAEYYSILDQNLLLLEADESGSIIRANTNFCDFLGETSESLKGKSCADLVPRLDCQNLWPWETKNPEEKISSQFPFTTSWDELKWVDGMFVKLPANQLQTERHFLIATDGTKRKINENYNAEVVHGVSSASALVEFDTNGKILTTNSTFLQLVGYARDELIGQNHSIFLPQDEYLSDSLDKFWGELRSGKVQAGQFQRFNRLGEALFIHGVYFPVRDLLGRVNKILMFAFDATAASSERENLEIEIEQLRVRNVELMDAYSRLLVLGATVSIGLFATDEGGNLCWMNRTLCQLVQRNYQELHGKSIDYSVHPADASRVTAEWTKCIGSRSSYKSTHRIITLNGSTLSVEVTANPAFNQDMFIGFVGTVNDLTEQEIAKERLNLATSAAKIGIWDWHIPEDRLIWDSTMLSIYGINSHEYQGAYVSWTNALVSGDRQRAEYELKESLETGKMFESKYRIRRPDGQIRVVQATGCVIRDHLEQPIRVIGTNIDVTEQHEREAEMRLMRKAAETAAQAKSDFLANMSHEIRTPLTSIIGYAENAASHDFTDQQRRDALHAIMVNGQHLQQIINDILDLSKINAGALRFEKKSYSPIQLVRELEAMLGSRFSEKGLDFKIIMVWSLPATANGDSFRISQILINLLSNAIKFTSRGSVTLKMWCEQDKELLHFEVTDTGIGMDTATLNKLFTPFSQGDDSTTRKFGGTGLGLTISKELVSRMGGTITVRSDIGVGTTFSFNVPTGSLSGVQWLFEEITNNQVLVHEKEASPMEEIKGLTGKVLVADDAPEVRSLLQFALQVTDLDLTFVTDGRQAVDLATSQAFDLIMLDMQMPVMDGYTAAKELRNSGITIPIIAFTANALAEYVDKSLAAGCSEILVKPFTKRALATCLLSNLGKDAKTHTAIPPLFEQPTEGEDKEVLQDVTVCSLFEEDPEMLELVYAFVDILGMRLQRLTVLNSNGDHTQISEMLHTMKGSAKMYGYPLLDDIVEELSSANKNRDTELFASLIDKLEDAFCSIVRGVVVMEQKIRRVDVGQPN